MPYKADEVKVGLVIVVTLLILAAFIIAILGLKIGQPTATYTTTLKYIGGIEIGKSVRFGGMPVGRVTRLSVSKQDNTLIQVTMDITQGTPVKSDSVAFVDTLGFIGDFYVEISTGTQGASLLPSGSEIPGREIVTFNDVLASAQSAVEKMNDTLTIVNDKILTQEFPELRDEVMATTEKMSKLLVDADQILEENRKNISQTIEEIKALVQDNRQEIRDTVVAFHQASQKLESLADTLDTLVVENKDEVKTAVQDIRDMAAQARAVAERIDKLIAENSNNVTLTVENLKATSANARDFSEEIARQPWRLIWRTREPEKKPIGQ